METDLNTARKVAVALVAATMSVGLLGISAPAHADTTWGWHSRSLSVNSQIESGTQLTPHLFGPSATPLA